MNRHKTTFRNVWPAASLLGLCVLVANGCDIPLYRATETLTDVFQTSSKPKVIVETFNGSIDISNHRMAPVFS